MSAREAHLANFFPELFHCSGFAIFGKATADGHIYHGRVLDYLKGVGLEQNAVTIVHQPDYGHAWINISYAGFVGSVTAMNDQGISIGEMGGGGYGNRRRGRLSARFSLRCLSARAVFFEPLFLFVAKFVVAHETHDGRLGIRRDLDEVDVFLGRASLSAALKAITPRFSPFFADHADFGCGYLVGSSSMITPVNTNTTRKIVGASLVSN